MERKKIRSYVVDASVAVKWFVDEDGSDKARLIRDQFVTGRLGLIAPDLLRYEVASALRYHPIAEIDAASLTTAMDAIENYQFLVKPSREAWGRAIQLCYVARISPYDAIYLGVSHTLKLPLLTADEKLIGKLAADEKINVTSLTKLVEEHEDKSNENDRALEHA